MNEQAKGNLQARNKAEAYFAVMLNALVAQVRKEVEAQKEEREEADIVGKFLRRGWLPPEEGIMWKETVIEELEDCFDLAPHDNDYFRILVADCLAYLKTGKRPGQLADEG